jgi:hypothetical protein
MLPDDFQFSQASLQDYADCPRRFYLRYLRRVAWPAVEAEPVLRHEAHMQRALDFHRMVHQHLLGVSEARLTAQAGEGDLRVWWENYLAAQPADIEGEHFPELTLSAPLAGYRLIAQYDLVVLTPDGRALIFDWKTSGRRTSRRWLMERLQTRVYRYLLVQAGGHLRAASIDPSSVTMIYWFANFPHDPERLLYDAEQHAGDETTLHQMIAEIRDRSDEDAFALTDDEQRCRFCPYRSLCDRGQEAGDFEAMEEPEPERVGAFDLDFDQVAEVEF